jgi:hypothetical protein
MQRYNLTLYSPSMASGAANSTTSPTHAGPRSAGVTGQYKALG